LFCLTSPPRLPQGFLNQRLFAVTDRACTLPVFVFFFFFRSDPCLARSCPFSFFWLLEKTLGPPNSSFCRGLFVVHVTNGLFSPFSPNSCFFFSPPSPPPLTRLVSQFWFPCFSKGVDLCLLGGSLVVFFCPSVLVLSRHVSNFLIDSQHAPPFFFFGYRLFLPDASESLGWEDGGAPPSQVPPYHL